MLVRHELDVELGDLDRSDIQGRQNCRVRSLHDDLRTLGAAQALLIAGQEDSLVGRH